MLSVKTGNIISMTETLLSIILLLSFANIVLTQTYNDAVCNGSLIQSLRETQKESDNVDPYGITSPTTPTTYTIVPPIGGLDAQFLSSAIDPITGTVYTIFRLKSDPTKKHYLGTLDSTTSTITPIGSFGSSTDITGMTFDCDGNLYAINFIDRNIYLMNTTDANITLFQPGGATACASAGKECHEVISYHWENQNLYRISSEAPVAVIPLLYVESLDTDTETQYTIHDPNGYCTARVIGMEYIGNDLFLISCSGAEQGIRLLDTSDLNNVTILPIGTDGIALGGSSSGAGLLPSDSNGLCIPQCPTTVSPTTSLPTTVTPTTAQPTTAQPTTATPTDITSTPTTTPTTTTPTTATPTTASPITAAPTIAPTDITYSPTTAAPTVTSCPTCPYNISLVDISSVSLSSDCPTISPTTKSNSNPRKYWNRYSKSDSSVVVPRKKLHKYNENSIDSSGSGSGSDSDSDRRRRMVTVSSDSDDSIDRCFSNGDALIFVDDLCSNDNTEWHSSDSGSGSDSSDFVLQTEAFLATICVTYDINNIAGDVNVDCGEINNIFLGLCENMDTDFDSTLLGIADIDRIISNDTYENGNNVLNVRGARNSNGVLGVLIILDNVDSFILCFENVTVNTGFNQTKDLLEVTDGYVNFTNSAGEATLCPSQGLPCLNFFFGCEDDLIGPEESVADLYSVHLLSETRNCNCNNGMTTLTLRYEGSVSAQRIIGFYGRRARVICTFDNVLAGHTITCTAEKTRTGIFARNTRFAVSYSDNEDDSCLGKIRTSCSNQIIGDVLAGCNDLVVVSHIDGDGALCDAQILAAHTENAANAFINGREYMDNPLEILKEFDPYIRWTLICIIIAFIILMFVSIYICFSYKCKKIDNEEEEDDVIASAINIAMSQKHNNHVHTTNDLNQDIDIDDDTIKPFKIIQ